MQGGQKKFVVKAINRLSEDSHTQNGKVREREKIAGARNTPRGGVFCEKSEISKGLGEGAIDAGVQHLMGEGEVTKGGKRAKAD